MTKAEKLLSIMSEDIKTQYKYINMVKVKSEDKDKKTSIWNVNNNNSGVQLGQIKYNPKWKQYCFFPNGKTIFSKDCLEDVNDFINQISKKK